MPSTSPDSQIREPGKEGGAPPPPPPYGTPTETGGAPGRDANESVLEALGDPVSRRLLLELNRAEQDVHGLVLRTGLPQSSVYRKLKELGNLGFVRVSRFAFTPDGKKVEVYRSRIQEVRIHLSGAELRVEVRYVTDAAERLGEMWRAVRGGRK